MLYDKTQSGYGKHLYKLKKMHKLAVAIVLVLIAAVSIPLIASIRSKISDKRQELLRVWNANDFEQAYEMSKNSLSSKPLDYFLLTYNGFSAYQLGISQINAFNTIVYIDECIRSLRKALLLKNSSADGRVCYVLGKAYAYKGEEYADLSIKYLEAAKNLSYNAADIPEYLGLAYAAYGDYRSSVEAFSEALVLSQKPSDSLLLSIARSYMELEEYVIAVDYLQRCIDSSPDSNSILVARLLLAEVFRITGNHDGAENQYVSILKDAGENAEVHYQLGELYSLKGDAVRARSEWRLAYRQDPAHAKARTRLNM
jgi:tetratricopeptide (TPR) repeat protein